jgi:hypothetical protein
MLRRSVFLHNFFPLGKGSGPSAKTIAKPPFNTIIKQNSPISMKKCKRVHRDQLEIKCPHCRFLWHYDVLSIWCAADKLHYQREHGMPHTWIWNRQQPVKFYKWKPLTFDPKTGLLLCSEDAKKKNQERRDAGLTTKIRAKHRDSLGISKHMAPMGTFQATWRQHNPFPT